MLRVYVCAAAAIAAGAGVSLGQTILQPTGPQSKDAFVYSFLANLNFNATPGFDTILASGRSNSGHDLRSLVQFDLTGVTMQAGEIATLNLFVADGGTVGFPVVNPSPAGAVTTDVFPVTSAWDASTVTWATQPTFGATVVDTEVIDSINHYVSFDVTSLVQSWLNSPSTNNGFSVQQREVVLNGGSVQAVYHSANSANRPFLYVGPVPEPSQAIALGATVFLAARRRR